MKPNLLHACIQEVQISGCCRPADAAHYQSCSASHIFIDPTERKYTISTFVALYVPGISMAMCNINRSTKYEDITSRSHLIQSGHPSTYQLLTKTETFGNLRRITFGLKDHNKVNKTILLVGETGTGKSTLVKAVLNYTMGVKWEDDVWFEFGNEEKSNESEKHTLDLIVYEIFNFKENILPFSLTIIDTPEVSCKLNELFNSENGIYEINVVGLVLKSTENYLSDRLHYENIVALITHSNGKPPKKVLQALETAKIKCAKNDKKQPIYFLFDNCQDVQRRDNEEDCSYKVTMEGMNQFTEFIAKITPQKLQKTQHVLKDRIELKACIQNLLQRIEFIELKQREIQQTETVLWKHNENMKRNENFIIEVDEVYKEKEPIDGGLWENCHYPGCSIAWYPRDCQVMKQGHCTVCTRKCPVSSHVKEKQKYVNKTKKVKKNIKTMKDSFEWNKKEYEESECLLEVLKRESRELEAEKTKLLDESYDHIVQLEQVALNSFSLSILVHLDFLIEKMKEKKDSEKVKKLMKIKDEADKGASAGLRYLKTAPSGCEQK
ncbi:hypothetical protein Q5P01_024379 [Channa striata]|uniref:Uncharacterized protein n=1 Tax=Channa striata TaxID=64152 RepID=A0AA88LQB1_CHASR|nr:hypothetical protein Q5P01_024379 [Channa striata]